MINREKVDIRQTWDLSLLFKTEEIYENTLSQFNKDVTQFVQTYAGNLKAVKDVNEALAAYRKLKETQVQLSTYCSLDVNVDTTNKCAQERAAHAEKVFAQLNANLSFFFSELADLDAVILQEAAKNEEDRRTLEKILQEKAHRLSPQAEATLAALSNTLDYGYQFYNDVKFKDISFPTFTAKGQSFEMTYNSFEGRQESEINTEIRRAAFKNFSDTLRQYANSTASAYNLQVQTEKTLSQLRGYQSVFDYLLEPQEVSRELYDRQIDVIMTELAPYMRKYATLIGKIYNLDQVRYEDLKLPIDPSFSPSVDFETAKTYVLEGLEPLGEDYLSIMKEAFDKRWIDYAETRGKRTGAFCSSPYGANSFILMFFAQDMSDVMTLAHELGHAGHFQNAHRYQNISNSHSSMYFVEAPSTTNELLVENYLLDRSADDKRMKRWVLSQMVGKTYYHNFVTHLLEAYYQREVYRLVDQGKSLDADILNQIFRETLEKFWGDSIMLSDGAELTWMRQPHYYMGLYSYTYSAGLTIGTQVAQKIRQEGAAAAKNWIRVLQMGGSKPAEELAKEAGVDISTDQPLKDTIAFIGAMIEEMITITEELKDTH